MILYNNSWQFEKILLDCALFYQCFYQYQAFPINGMKQKTAIVFALIRRFQYVARTNHRQGFINVVFISYQSKEFFQYFILS